MRLFKFCFIFISIFSNVFPMEIANVSAENLDEFYSELLNLTSNGMEMNEQLNKDLKLKIEFSILFSNIRQMFDSIKTTKKWQKESVEKERKTFEQIFRHTFEFSKQISHTEICTIWKFWRGLGDFFVENNFLQNLEIAKYVKMRDKIHSNEINCEKIEKEICQNKQKMSDEEEEESATNIYLRDIQQLHFSAIIFLLHPKNKVGKTVQIGFLGTYKIWEFSKFFNNAKIEMETNFAYQLRIQRQKNDEESEFWMKKLKIKINELIGTVFMKILEFLRPIELQIETLYDSEFAKDYATIFLYDRNVATQAELQLSIRIYFGQIWDKFLNGQLAKNVREKAQIIQLWDGGEFEAMIETLFECGKETLEKILEFSNKIGLKNNWKKEKMTEKKSGKLKKKEEICEDIFEIVRKELLEQHTQKMLILRDQKNAFSKLMANSLALEKGALAKLHDFYSGKNFVGTDSTEKCSSIWREILSKMVKKYPKLKQMLRNELTDGLIQQLQIRNYTKYFNKNSDAMALARAKFLIDILAYYQSFKIQLKCPNFLPFQIELFNESLAIMELSMDSIISINSVEEIEELQINKTKALKNITNLFPDKLSAIIGHDQILHKLCACEQFRTKLNAICVDCERMRKFFRKNDELFYCDLLTTQSDWEEENSTPKGAQIEDESTKVGKKAWETEIDLEEGNALTYVYNKLLFAKNGEMSDSADQLLLINATHFQFKLWVKRMLQILDILKNKNFAKFTRLAIELGIEATKKEFFGTEKHHESKKVKICQMLSFIFHLMANGTLKENENWTEFVTEFSGQIEFLTVINEKFRLTEKEDENNQRWVSSKCEDQRFVHLLIAYLKMPNIQCQIHMRVIHVLFLHFDEFLKHIAFKGINFTKIRDYDATIDRNELLKFYIKHLTALNYFDDRSLEDEHKIGVLIKLLSMRVFRDEKTVLKSSEMSQQFIGQNEKVISEISKFTTFVREIYMAKAETYVMLRITELFSENSGPIRMLCPLLHYIVFLEKQLANAPNRPNWQYFLKCFQMEIGEINRNQMKVLAKEHFTLLVSFINTFTEKDELLRILREKHGAMYRLRLLLGGKGAIQRLWEMAEMRKKLHNRKFFTNKMLLLDHYHRFLRFDDEIGSNAAELRLAQRFGADIFVWMNWLETDRPNQCIKVQKLLDELFLYFRLFYDSYSICTETTNSMRASSIVLPAIKKFLDENRNKQLNERKIYKEWSKLSKIVIKVEDLVEKSELSEEDRKKYEKPTEIIQKMHFKEFEQFLSGDFGDEEEEEAKKETFGRILEEIISNKNKQQKMNAFLTENDLKMFFEAIGIKEKSNEKKENENENEKKKKAKNRRKKEKNKIKIEKNEEMTSEENENENKNLNLNEKIMGENKNEQNEKKNRNSDEKTEAKNAVAKMGRDIGEYIERRKQFKHNLDEEMAKINYVKDFYDDTFLYGKYEEFVANPSMEMQRIIDVGTFVNEIGRRLKAMKEMEKFNYIENSQNKKRIGQLEKEWTEFLKKFDKFDEQKLGELEKKAENILLNLINNFENSKNLSAKEIVKQMKVPIHLRNLSMALLKNSEFDEKWKSLVTKMKKEKLFYLLDERFGRECFEKVKLEWESATEQIGLDIALYDKYLLSKVQQNKHICPEFPFLTQQIYFCDNKTAENLENYLLMEINGNSADETETNERKIGEGLNKIQAIVAEWSNGTAQLHISGSFLLGTQTAFSDIDLLCLVPGKVIKIANFLGEESVFCKENKCAANENDFSLYCKLCETKGVKNLIRTPFGKVFLIKFELEEIDFDLTFVAILAKQILPFPLTDQQIGKFINTFKWAKNFAHKNMMRALSSYRFTFYIANLFGENSANCAAFPLQPTIDEKKGKKLENKKGKNFQNLILFLKIWAKKNHIYSNVYGYLNGSMLAIMATKIILFYPNASLPFLIQKFFIFYLARSIRVPVQLTKLKLEENLDSNKNLDPFFVRKPDEQEMPVYTPMFPEQNVARLVTHYAVRVIRREMKIALKQINEKNWLELITKAAPFKEKYKTFILVNCASEHVDLGEHFCQFVSGRIRLQIVFDIDQKGNGKTETQLYDGIYQEKCPMEKELQFSSFKPNYCKIWLIGMQSDQSEEIIFRNLENFDLKIKSDFIKYNYPNEDGKKRINFLAEEIKEKFAELKIELKSIIVDKEQIELRN